MGQWFTKCTRKEKKQQQQEATRYEHAPSPLSQPARAADLSIVTPTSDQAYDDRRREIEEAVIAYDVETSKLESIVNLGRNIATLWVCELSRILQNNGLWLYWVPVKPVPSMAVVATRTWEPILSDKIRIFQHAMNAQIECRLDQRKLQMDAMQRLSRAMDHWSGLWLYFLHRTQLDVWLPSSRGIQIIRGYYDVVWETEEVLTRGSRCMECHEDAHESHGSSHVDDDPKREWKTQDCQVEAHLHSPTYQHLCRTLIPSQEKPQPVKKEEGMKLILLDHMLWNVHDWVCCPGRHKTHSCVCLLPPKGPPTGAVLRIAY